MELLLCYEVVLDMLDALQDVVVQISHAGKYNLCLCLSRTELFVLEQKRTSLRSAAGLLSF